MFKIQESTENLNTLLVTDLFTGETKKRVKNADIILTPDVGKFDGIPKAFKPDTKTFYKFAIANNPSGKKIEVLEDEGELTVLNLHSHEVWLPNLYIKDMTLLPTVIDVVNQYVSEKQKRHQDDDLIVNFNLKIENRDEACQLIIFKGTLDEFNQSLKNF